MTERRAAVRSVLLYALAIGTVSGANFVAVPLLLTLLGHEEFGRLALLEPILLVALPAAGLGIQIGLLRLIKGCKSDASVVAAVLPFHLGAAAIVGVVAAGAALSFGAPWPTSMLLGALVALEGSIIFFAGLWRAQNKPELFATVEGGRAALIAAALGVALFLSSELLVEDYLLLRLCISLATVVLALAVTRPLFRPNLLEAQRAVSYGAPIVVASMLAAMLISVDRYALARVDAAELADYVAHVKLAQLLSVAVAAFYTWFAPKAIQRLGDGPQAHPFLVGSTTLFVVALVAICANVWLLVPLIWSWFFPTVSLDRQLFGILLISTAVLSLGNPLSLGALRPGKTHHAVIIALGALAIGAAASFALAGPLGEVGAALGRGLGAAAYSTFFAVSTVTRLRIRYPWASYAAIVCGATVICLVAEQALIGSDLRFALARLALLNGVFLLLVWWRASSVRRQVSQ